MATYALVGVSVPEGLDAVPPVDPGRIARELRDIAEQVGVAFEGMDMAALPLKTFELGLTLTEEGSVGFFGIGAKVDAGQSITLTFESS